MRPKIRRIVTMNINLAGFFNNDTDTKLLIILIFVLIIAFILLALIGMAIRKVNKLFQKRMDNEIHDVCVYRIVQNAGELKKYGIKKNNYLFMKQISIPFLILLVSLIIYFIYAGLTNNWNEDYFGHFGTLFFQWDFGNPDNYSNFFGLTLLSSWPALSNTPTWHNEYWASYILVPLWLISICYTIVVSQAYVSRFLQLNKRCRTVFDKNLDDFNFYDDIKKPSSVEAEKLKAEVQKDEAK